MQARSSLEAIKAKVVTAKRLLTANETESLLPIRHIGEVAARSQAAEERNVGRVSLNPGDLAPAWPHGTWL